MPDSMLGSGHEMVAARSEDGPFHLWPAAAVEADRRSPEAERERVQLAVACEELRPSIKSKEGRPTFCSPRGTHRAV
jgi:hypothetical protein